jgi:adenylyltransferase/sulfurtransferase
MPELGEAQIERYARHLVLDEIGEAGQEKLLAASVLVIGAGGLGSPLLLYLAAAGVGRLGIVDDDAVALSNLQRQVIHTTARIGRNKAASAAETLRDLNPEILVDLHPFRLTAENVAELVRGYDLVADGSDNPATRYLVNEACVAAGKTLVAGSVFRFEGQISTFKPHAGPSHPCYRCVFPEPLVLPRCEEAGILGPVAGVIGTLQAMEVVKEILGLGSSLSGTLLLYDSLAPEFYTVAAKRNPGCRSCSDGGAPSTTLRAVPLPRVAEEDT